ncbi:hypothetical protein K435DRAFT_815241 [Dendrothele bispora CBS 962.96]|uniref:Copper transport protein n=1 Tax=Dendrothele bispora (strain CBS 962.96) TaxID=1314807 RepID=A0A4S8MX88_DENBC|nr:hypothetical protein K435DRAFT_815241 [Dendrothele bispora CBS 962.96]
MSDMDMSDSSNSTSSSSSMSSMMMMVPYLHFTPGDNLLFEKVKPSSGGAIFGACLILFLLAILDRYVRAARRGLERRFALRAILPAESSGSKQPLPTTESALCCQPPQSRFILSHDLTRGVMTGVELTLHYLLMLVVMTFNAAYIISVILGASIGEIAFGRLHRGY